MTMITICQKSKIKLFEVIMLRNLHCVIPSIIPDLVKPFSLLLSKVSYLILTPLFDVHDVDYF